MTIFNEEKIKFIVPKEEEKNLFAKFYKKVINNIKDEDYINKLCLSFENELLSKQRLFGNVIKINGNN